MAGTALVVTSPLLFFVGLVVRLDSNGPAIFRQERVGRDGKTFRIHKFRTLHTDVPGPLISKTYDPRVTRVGAVLRRTKLDELPQLFDVLLGHMSIVGPRPEVPRYVAMWPAEERETILSVRPGITDPASIKFRNEAEQLERAADPEAFYVNVLLPLKVAMYAEYVRSHSFSNDMMIIGKTIGTVVRN